MSYFPEIIKDGLRFIIAKISDSRKEIELRLVSNLISQNEDKFYDLGIFGQQAGLKNQASFYTRLNTILEGVINSDNQDAVIPISDGTYIPLVNVNYYVDSFSALDDESRYLFVLKLHKALPPTIKKLDSFTILIQQTDISKNEIFYGGKIKKRLQKFGYPLNVDYTINPLDKLIKETDTYQNKTQITSSLPSYRLEGIQSGSTYESDLVDYREFKNFIYFSSAEKRLENFKTKLQTIETEYNQISSSLVAHNQNLGDVNGPVTEIRKKGFTKINNIINNFTGYEKWLYFDNQITSKFSPPGLGVQYTDTSEELELSPNLSQQFNREGFDVVYALSGSSDESINIVTDKYKLDSRIINNTTGSIHLSFLLRASSSVSNNLVHQNVQTSSVPSYPMDSLNIETLRAPTATGSQYRRYIFKSSGSYWRPANINKIVGLNTIDFGKNSSEIILTSGSSIFSKPVSALGDYKNYHTYHKSEGGISFSGSLVPKGDLFHLFVKPTGDTNLQGIITDVKVSENDPTNILPFHHLHSTDSDKFTTWYNGMISSASFYDSQNIQRLVNNIPRSYLDDASTNIEMITYVNTIAEFFDEYKTLIDDYYRIFNKGYSDYEQVPAKFNKLLSANLGFNIFPIQNNNFLELFGIGENLNNAEDYSNKVINNVLNNINYLYKTKGTQNSIKALLNCYGLPSNVLRIKEGQSNSLEYDDSILSNDAIISPIDVFNLTGSISYQTKTDNLNSLLISEEFKGGVPLKWNTNNELTQSAVEAVFKIPKTSNTMSLVTSKTSDDSKELWQLQLMPSSGTQAKLRFRISSQAGGSSASDIKNSSLFVDSDNLNIMDNSLINVAIQKSSSGHDISEIHTYDLLVGKSSGGKITFLNSKSFTIDGDSESNGNNNFITGSEGSHLFFTNDFTGSVAQIKSWSTPLSFKTFKQHIFNKKSIVGNKFSSSIDELQYYYPLQENYTSGSSPEFRLLDSSTKKKGGDVIIDSNIFNSASIHPYDTTQIETITFPQYGYGGGTLGSGENLVVIPEQQEMISDLKYDKSVLRFNTNREKQEAHNREIFLERSPQEIINDFLIDNLGNLDFNDLFADPRDEFKSTYPDLDAFNEKLRDYNISVDMTRFIDATKKIFNNSFVQSLRKLLPAKAKVTLGNVIKPTLTDRVKIPPLQERPSVQLLSQPIAEKQNFESPKTLGGGLFTPPEDTFIGFKKGHRSSSLGDFEETQVFDIGQNQEENISNEYIHNASLFKQQPQKLWGNTINDVFFKSETDRGKDGNYNNYHYEEDVVFTGITDVEFVNHTTSSNNKIVNTNYTASNTFVNKKLLETSVVVGKRPLGVTQQLFPTSSNESPFGRVLDSDTRVPTNHISYFQTLKYYDDFYEGTKLGNYNNIFKPGSVTWRAEENFSPFSTDEGQTPTWQDLATASFYRIKYNDGGNNTLRIVRPDIPDTDENQLN